MACETCARMRARLKQMLARKTGQEWKGGETSAAAVPAAHEGEGARGQEAQDQAGQPASQPRSAYVEPAMEGDTPAGAER